MRYTVIETVLSDKNADLYERYGGMILSAALIFFVGFTFAKFIRILVRKMMINSKIDNSSVGIVSQVVYFVVLISVILAVCSRIGIPISSFVAIIGAFGVSVGLALKDSIKDLASGILILIFKPFKAGDFVETEDGKSGTVNEIQLMTTTFTTPDNRLLIVPNSIITSEKLINYSVYPIRRINITLTVSYDADIDKVIDILKTVYENDAEVLKEPEPYIGVNDFNENGVEVVAMPWVKSDNYFKIFHRLMKTIKTEFDAEKINFALPSRQIQIKERKIQ